MWQYFLLFQHRKEYREKHIKFHFIVTSINPNPIKFKTFYISIALCMYIVWSWICNFWAVNLIGCHENKCNFQKSCTSRAKIMSNKLKDMLTNLQCMQVKYRRMMEHRLMGCQIRKMVFLHLCDLIAWKNLIRLKYDN